MKKYNMKTKILMIGIILAGKKIFFAGEFFSLQQALDYAFTHNRITTDADLDAKNEAPIIKTR